MKPIRWDSGLRWGNPNLRWGSPSVELEPGDPGYVPPAPPAPPVIKPKPKIMSSNETPKNPQILRALAHSILDGQVAHEASVGLHHHKAAQMAAALKKLEGDAAAPPGSAANKGSQLLYKECEDLTDAALAAMVAESDGPVRTWLLGYRKVMEGIHGRTANAGWEAAGFEAGSTKVPQAHEKRLALLTAGRAYLAGHAGYETNLPQATGPALAITAAEALARGTALQAKRTAVNAQQGEQAACKAVRDADVAGLFNEVSDTIAELRLILPADDARWELFGLNVPAHPRAPEAVAALTVSPAGSGRLLAEWSWAVRATHFRIFLKRVGTDTAFVNVADSDDLEYVLKNLAPGSMAEVYVTAANEAGDGPPSPTVSTLVP